MDKCINCGKEIPDPVFSLAGRRHGKNAMILYYNTRQMCCSNECFCKIMKEIEEEFYGGGEADAY